MLDKTFIVDNIREKFNVSVEYIKMLENIIDYTNDVEPMAYEAGREFVQQMMDGTIGMTPDDYEELFLNDDELLIVRTLEHWHILDNDYALCSDESRDGFYSVEALFRYCLQEDHGKVFTPTGLLTEEGKKGYEILHQYITQINKKLTDENQIDWDIVKTEIDRIIREEL